MVSLRRLYFEWAKIKASGRPDPYVWLKNLTPTMRAGLSILIFDLK